MNRTHENLQEFCKSIDIDIKKLEDEMLKVNCREVYYNPFNDEVVLIMSDGNNIYIKREDLLER